MHTPDNAEALLALIAEQQKHIITLRAEIATLEKKSEQYRSWWLDEETEKKAIIEATGYKAETVKI